MNVSVARKQWGLVRSKGILKVEGNKQLQEKEIYRFQRNTSLKIVQWGISNTLSCGRNGGKGSPWACMTAIVRL